MNARIEVDGGLGADFTPQDARDYFEKARQLHKPGGGYRLNLYIAGALVDTVELDAFGVKLVTGSAPERRENV